jgi:hypothetical protein
MSYAPIYEPIVKAANDRIEQATQELIRAHNEIDRLDHLVRLLQRRQLEAADILHAAADRLRAGKVEP